MASTSCSNVQQKLINFEKLIKKEREVYNHEEVFHYAGDDF